MYCEYREMYNNKYDENGAHFYAQQELEFEIGVTMNNPRSGPRFYFEVVDADKYVRMKLSR